LDQVNGQEILSFGILLFQLLIMDGRYTPPIDSPPQSGGGNEEFADPLRGMLLQKFSFFYSRTLEFEKKPYTMVRPAPPSTSPLFLVFPTITELPA